MADEPGSDESDLKGMHDLGIALRNEGYKLDFGASRSTDFEDHVTQAKALLDVDDLDGCFVLTHRDDQISYVGSVDAANPFTDDITHLEMLGVHFRTVLTKTSLSTTELVDAIVDEALAAGEVDDNAE